MIGKPGAKIELKTRNSKFINTDKKTCQKAKCSVVLHSAGNLLCKLFLLKSLIISSQTQIFSIKT
jgi:hypothetical protein